MRAADTIAAPSTAPGAGALAVIRLSGPRSLAILESVFHPSGPPAPWTPRRLRRGRIVREGRLLDDGLAVWFPAPHSYTGEESAEIHGHGGPAVVALTLEALLAAGAELAQPGEFTKRAFLNGRLDLPQAEAVADLVAARSAAEAALAARQLAGGLSSRLKEIGALIFSALAELEAGLNFGEEAEGLSPALLGERLRREIQPRLKALMADGRTGRYFRQGLKVVLAGAPNVGKSSLFNALAGSERALVSPLAGTTRDYVTAEAVWRGLRVELCDTAGLSAAPADELDERGQARSRAQAAAADIVLWVRDCLNGASGAEEPPPAERLIEVWNKADLAPPPAGEALAVSALTGLNLETLKAAVMQLAAGREDPPEAVPNLRHLAALTEAENYIQALLTIIDEGAPPDICAVELRAAFTALEGVLGRSAPDDLLNEIFSRFCLGK